MFSILPGACVRIALSYLKPAARRAQQRLSYLFVLTEIMAHIEELDARMGRFEQTLQQGLSAWHPQLKLLQTIPGIGQMGAAMLLVEISANLDSFGRAEKLASWVGICPGTIESVGKRKSGKTRKGNTGSGVCCASSPKPLRIIFAMRKNNKPYRDLAVDYEASSIQKTHHAG